VTERPERTPFAGFPAAHAAGTFASFARGYRRFRCRECGKQYNERSGGLLNRAHHPSDVIALVVLWRLRYRLTLQDLSEMFLQRGIVFSYEAVRDWEAKLAPVLAGELRRRRNGKGGANRRRWHVDETYLKVRGRWCYLYRAIDRNGDLVDTMLSEHRDRAAAQAFFRSAKSVTGQVPERVTTDGHGSYPRAIRSTLGRHVVHRTSAYKNNRLEQDHRGVKGRTRCMRGFKSFASAERFCRGYGELRNFLRPRTRHNQHIPANRRRLLHLRRASSALAMLEAA
jgi:transposase-like protein